MTKKVEYSELLKDPRWQKKRLQIFERDKYACRCCKDTTTELHVHHKQYVQGKDPWDYPDEDLITYCRFCHGLIGGDKLKILGITDAIAINSITPTDRKMRIYKITQDKMLIVVFYPDGTISFTGVLEDELKTKIIDMLK